MITISNNFHNTETRVRNTDLSYSTVKRIQRTLCGCEGCTCGGELSERPADSISDDDGNQYGWAPGPGYYNKGEAGAYIELRRIG